MNVQILRALGLKEDHFVASIDGTHIIHSTHVVLALQLSLTLRVRQHVAKVLHEDITCQRDPFSSKVMRAMMAEARGQGQEKKKKGKKVPLTHSSSECTSIR